MKIEGNINSWWSRAAIGPFIDFEEWNIWHHYFTIGFSFWKWDIGVTVTLWDVEEEVQKLEARGMTEEQAFSFCDEIRRKQSDPYSGNLKKVIQRELAVMASNKD